MGLGMETEMDAADSEDDSTTIEYEIEVIDSSSSVSLSLASSANLQSLETTNQFYAINQIEDETVDEEPIEFLVIAEDEREDLEIAGAIGQLLVADHGHHDKCADVELEAVAEEEQQVIGHREHCPPARIPSPDSELDNGPDNDSISVVVSDLMMEAVDSHHRKPADQVGQEQAPSPLETKLELKPPLIHLSEQTKFTVTEDNPRAAEPMIIKDSYRWPARQQVEPQRSVGAEYASTASKMPPSGGEGQREAGDEKQRATFAKTSLDLDRISWRGPHLEDYGFIGEAISVCVYDTGEVNQWPMLSPILLDSAAFDLEGDDLERELDEEPQFERRQVELKRGGDRLRSEYSLGDELGRGKFGTVFRCREAASGRQFAAKFVHLRHQADHEDVLREINIMSLLQHKRLLQLHDAYDDEPGHQMCLITELIEGGELFERIIDDDFELTERKAAIFMRQICEGVEYMHSMAIVHLDMKPENILCVSKTGCRIKLIDFGLARQLTSGDPLRVMFGTPDFAAPEVLAYDTVSLATDMWSVGVICYVLLSGLSPFMGDNDIETMANVTRATYDFDDPAFDPISELAKDFIAKLLVREQVKRLKPGECLRHPWLQRGGKPLEMARRCIASRRQSLVPTSAIESHQLHHHNDHHHHHHNHHNHLHHHHHHHHHQHHHHCMEAERSYTLPLMVSLDKRNLKKYVVRRKWHKTVHAIMALGRMGANLKQLK